MKIFCLGEILMRYSSEDFMQSSNFDFYYGGAELNVATYLSSFNHDVSLISAIPDNALGTKALRFLNLNKINSDHVYFFGSRIGSYFVENSNDYVPTNVIYDRNASSFATFKDYDFASILEGDVFHVSGVSAAVMGCDIVLKAIEIAVLKKMKISYDSNFRSKLWSAQEAGDFLKKILKYVDYASIGLLDIKYLLNYDVDNLEEAYKMVKKEYPNISLMYSQSRKIISPKKHIIQGHVFENELISSKKYEVDIVDRIGTGDAFAAGIIDYKLCGKSLIEIVEFGIMSSVLKHYEKGDSHFILKSKIESILNNDNLMIGR